MSGATPGRCLGLVGGLGVRATIHYYQNLVAAHSERGCAAHMLIAHADVNQAMRLVGNGALSELAAYFAQFVARLADGGAEIAVLPAITPHICARELTAISPLPLVNIVEAVAGAIRQRGLRRVALFGTRFSVESRLFGQLEDVDVVMPRKEEVDTIHSTYLQVVNDEAKDSESRETFREIAGTLLRREGVEAIVLAGTELSLIFNESNTDFPHLDCARVHMDAIMRRLFETP